MEIIIPIGIPGSGKSRLYKMRYSHMELVSPDVVRKEMTGSFNDYSKDNDVGKEIKRKMDDCIKNGKSFYYDNCNLVTDKRKCIIDYLHEKGDVKITYLVFPADFDLSLKRIYDDLENHAERGYVAVYFLAMFYGLYKYSLHTKFEGENVQKIIYLKPEDLD